MFWLGLLLPICYIPGITGASVPTQWALLSLVLPFLLWKIESPRAFHLTGLAFAVFAVLGLTWAPNIYDSGYGLWVVVLWGLSFQLGSLSESMTPLLKGLAVGLSISSILAIFQALGFTPVMVQNEGTAAANIAGLFYNRTVLGSFSALLILALIAENLWLYVPALLPGLWLSHSRGGLLILAFGLIARYIHWAVALILLLSAGIAATIVIDSSDDLRLKVWSVAWKGLTLRGWGPGSFNTVYFPVADGINHPEFVHNDYLQLWFEFGIASLAPMVILTTALIWSQSAVLYAAAALACFYFPLYCPLDAFLICYTAGHVLRDFSLTGLIVRSCRPDILPWSSHQRFGLSQSWREYLSIVSRT